MSRIQAANTTAATALIIGTLIAGQVGAGTLERALACALKPAELPALMKNLRAQDGGFRKPVAKLGMPTMDVFKLDAPVTAHGFTADEVVVAPTRIAMVLRGKTSMELGRSLTLQKAIPDAPGEAPNPYTPWERMVQPRYASLVAYQSSHHRLQDAALLGCQYAHNGAALWPDDVSAEDQMKIFQGMADMPAPK